MPAREKRRETAAGLFVLIGLLLLGVLVLQYGHLGDRFKDHYPLYVEFPDTDGLIEGSEVRLRGAKVGHVASSPELVTAGATSAVRMEMSLRDDIMIPVDSTFQICSSGFIGDKYIDIKPPEIESGDFYESGDTITGAGSGGFDAIKTDAENIAKDASILLKDAKTTFLKIDEALTEITILGQNLNVTMNKVNNSFLSEDNLNRLSTSISNFEAASKNIASASKDLKPTIADAKRTIAGLSKAADSADNLFTSAQKEIQNIEPALRDLPKAVKSISRAAGKAEDTMDALQNKDSLVGAMAYDRKTGNDAKEFVRNLKRYGILRYRDDSTKEEHDPRNKFRGSRR